MRTPRDHYKIDVLAWRAYQIRYAHRPGLWVPIIWHLALRGHSEAMVDLADWLSEGNSLAAFGKPADPFSAAGLYDRAFKAGNNRAALNAAASCFNRNDMAGYRTWLTRGSRAGDAQAAAELGFFETRLWHEAARKVRRLRPKMKRD